MSQMFRIDVPGGLLDRVLNRVHYEISLMAVKQRIVLFSVSSLVLTVLAFFAFGSLWSQLNNSGFFYFSGLIFSDFKVISSYWQTFVLATVQAIPVFSLLWSSLVLLALFKSLELLLKNTGRSWAFVKH